MKMIFLSEENKDLRIGVLGGDSRELLFFLSGHETILLCCMSAV